MVFIIIWSSKSFTPSQTFQNKNSQDFIRRVLDETDIQIEMISGSEEARLIYLGVLSGMAFEDQSYVIIDIGGGSTELILADKKDAIALTSSRIGAVRLKNDF